MDASQITQIITGVLVGVIAYFARRGHKENAKRDTRAQEVHKAVTNDIVHAVERMETTLDHVSQRLDDHIEGHVERTRRR
jgi:hypothetical protein